MGNRKKRAGAWRWRSATRVVDGIVQPKNRRTPTTGLLESLVIERERAGRGFRHVLTREDVRRFLGLFDDWETLGRGLRAVRLAEGSYTFGYWRRGVVAMCALPEHRRLARCYLDAYALRLFELLDVRAEMDLCERCGQRVETFELSIEQARAWQLLDVLCHELGHHHDAITNRGGLAERGERYALAFAEERWRGLWSRYQHAFHI